MYSPAFELSGRRWSRTAPAGLTIAPPTPSGVIGDRQVLAELETLESRHPASGSPDSRTHQSPSGPAPATDEWTCHAEFAPKCSGSLTLSYRPTILLVTCQQGGDDQAGQSRADGDRTHGCQCADACGTGSYATRPGSALHVFGLDAANRAYTRNGAPRLRVRRRRIRRDRPRSARAADWCASLVRSPSDISREGRRLQ
jgi:hypothetical protein